MESTQQFRYFLVMDFEATCWDGGQPTTAQEIIEFPAVLVDAVTLENVAEFREFVRPTWNPRLSAFCTQLTSIRQENVQTAFPLSNVLQRFGLWLDEHLDGGDAATIVPVTCGDWDLSKMLASEERQKGLSYHPTLQWWCNLKRPFALALRMNRDVGPDMDGMLRMLKLPLVGHHHLGIDDARNIAKILKTLVSKYGTVIEATGGTRPTGGTGPTGALQPSLQHLPPHRFPIPQIP